MKIYFSYHMVSQDSAELGVSYDNGAYNPITNSHYSIQQETMVQPREYCFNGSLDEALKQAARLHCNILDHKDKLSFSNAVKFHWYLPADAICYNVKFEDTTPEEFDYISSRLKEIKYPQNWFNKLFVIFR